MSFWPTLGYVAVLSYASNRLNKSTEDGSANTPAVDQGVRLQLDASTDNKIPVLYGDAYFGGNISDAAISADLTTMKYVLTLSELTGTKLSDGAATSYIFQDIYLDNDRVVFKADGLTVDYTVDSGGNQNIAMRDLVKIYFYSPSPQQPAGYAGTTPNSYDVMPAWDAINQPMTGLMYAIVEVTYNQPKGVTGLPDCLFHVKSDMVLPGDVLNDYMTNSVYGVDIASAEIDGTLSTLNAYCQAGFSYTDANAVVTSGPITFNGLVDTDTACLRNMTEIAKAGGSWLNYNVHEGKWTVVINTTASSVASISESNIIGEIGVTGTELTQLQNTVDVQYQNTDINDKVDFVKMTVPAAELNPFEPSTVLQMQLPFTNKQAVAMKLGLVALKQARVDKIITFTTDYSFISLKAGEVIDVTAMVGDYNFVNTPFRIMSLKETEANDGTINVEFTALEYVSTVYDYDITELNIVTDDGILGIGTIGKPDIPLITSNQSGNIPHVLIDGKVPSGVVDVMEYWITYDVSAPNDVDRSYIKIGQESNTDGSPFPENTIVRFQYNNLTAGDFLVKVRGTNARSTGPFSDPSGLIEYIPEVIADTVNPADPGYGVLLASLGTLFVLNNLSDFVDIFTGETSFWEGLENIFFPGSPLNQDTVANHLLQDQNFLDQLPGAQPPPAIPPIPDVLNDLSDVTTVQAAAGETLVFTGSVWAPIPGCCDLPTNCFTFSSTSPINGQTNGNYLACNGSPTIYFNTFDGTSTLYGGGGNAKLYKSDGTLVSTIASGAAIYTRITSTKYSVAIPFTGMAPCTDYHVHVDAGFVRDGAGCFSNEIGGAGSETCGWYFTTLQNEVCPDPPVGAPPAPGDPAPAPPITDPLPPPGEVVPPPVLPECAAGQDPEPVSSLDTFFDFFTPADATLGTGTVEIWDDDNLIWGGNETSPEVSVDETPAANFAIASTIPAHDSNTADIRDSLQIIFNDLVLANTTGGLYFYLYQGATLLQTFDLLKTHTTDNTNRDIYITGDTVNINPTVCFDFGSTYYITADADVVLGECGGKWPGIPDNTVFEFTVLKAAETIGAPPVEPNPNGGPAPETLIISGFDPMPGGGAAVNDNPIIATDTQDELVRVPGKKLQLREVGTGTVIEEIDSADERVNIN